MGLNYYKQRICKVLRVRKDIRIFSGFFMVSGTCVSEIFRLRDPAWYLSKESIYVFLRNWIVQTAGARKSGATAPLQSFIQYNELRCIKGTIFSSGNRKRIIIKISNIQKGKLNCYANRSLIFRIWSEFLCSSKVS